MNAFDGCVRSLISFLLDGEKVFCAPGDRILKPWPVKMGHKCAPKGRKELKREGGREGDEIKVQPGTVYVRVGIFRSFEPSCLAGLHTSGAG